MPRTARSISCVTDIRDKNEFEGEISVKGAVKKSEEVEKIRIFMQFGNICYGIWFA